MKRKSRILSLECLEDRWLPSSVSFSAGILQITETQKTSVVTITQDATTANKFTVSVPGTSNAGPFKNVTAIYFTGPNAGANSVTLNLGDNVYQGSFLANTGNGTDTVTVSNGREQGPVTIITGQGNATVNLGTTAATTFISTVQVIGNANWTNTLNLGFGGAIPLTVGTTQNNRDLDVTSFADVNQTAGAPITIHGSLSIQNSLTSVTNSILLNAAATVTIDDNLFLSLGTGAGDTVTLGNDASGNAIEVDGLLSISKSGGGATVTINGGGGGFVDLNINLQAGNNTVNLVDTVASTWIGSINFGAGDDALNFNNSATGTPDQSRFTGTANGGGGTNTLTFGTDWDVSTATFNGF